MKFSCLRFLLPLLLPLAACAQSPGDYVETYDTLYNNLTVERRGTVVEMRARSRAGIYLESAVDLENPFKLVVPYTRTLYAGLFFEPKPQRMLMIGLGGGGFHRLFAKSFPETVLHSVELDPKVYELSKTRMGFAPTDKTPVTIMDGRLFVKRTKEKWDWIILDAFRGGFVPPHLKTQEFYRECAAKLADRGVFVTNLHSGTQLYLSDLKTLTSVFAQVVLFRAGNRGNIIACAVKYKEPSASDTAKWPAAEELSKQLGGNLDMAEIRAEHIAFPTSDIARAKLLTDDFAPVEFLNIVESNNTKSDS